MVRQMEQARGVIAHFVLGARDVIMQGDVPVETLVPGLKAQQVGWGCIGGSRAFALPVESGCVVSFGEQCVLTDVKILGGSFVMEKATGQFEVRVCEGAPWVGGADQVFGKGGREWGTPEQWWWSSPMLGRQHGWGSPWDQ